MSEVERLNALEQSWGRKEKILERRKGKSEKPEGDLGTCSEKVGTTTGYQRHIKNREKPCSACRLAHNSYQRKHYWNDHEHAKVLATRKNAQRYKNLQSRIALEGREQGSSETCGDAVGTIRG